MITWDEALARFQTELARRKSDRTIEAYVGVVRRLHTQLQLLDEPAAVRPRLAAYWAELERRCVDEEISGAKIRGELAALRAFYDVLVTAKVYSENLARELRPGRTDPWLPRPMPMADVGRLFAAIPADAWQDRAMLSLFLNGLRNVEVCRMTT